MLKSLFEAGMARPDGLGMGLDVDGRSRVAGAERLWAVGPLTKGRFWEIVAVPDIRGQVADVAEDIAKELRVMTSQPGRRRSGAVVAQGGGARRGGGGGADADPLGGRRSRARRAARYAEAGGAGLAGICPGLCRGPGRRISRGPSRKSGGYDEIVLLKDIPFQSHCEHHLAPIIGKAAIAYLPGDKVVGISKLARVLHGFARRLQVQERLTAEVADCIWENLQPQGGRGGDRGGARLHDRAGRGDAGRADDHQPDDGLLPRRRAEPERSARPDGLLNLRSIENLASVN